MALHKMLQDPQFNIEALLTNVNSDTDRISMHGVRRSLLQKQAESIQIPLHTIELNSSPSLIEYEAVVDEKLLELKKEGLDTAVFGDIFLVRYLFVSDRRSCLSRPSRTKYFSQNRL